jgi:hypothetical protein
MSVLTFVLAVTHVVVAASWLGAMGYSLGVVQPRAERLLGDERYEELASVLAHGARWAVLAMAAVLAATGGGLAAVAASADGAPGWWLGLVLAKAALLAAAVAVFAHVSWRLWPRRIFALPGELPRLRHLFRVAAYTMVALVAANTVLGVAARTFR